MRSRAVILAAAIVIAPLGAWGADLVVCLQQGFHAQGDDRRLEMRQARTLSQDLRDYCFAGVDQRSLATAAQGAGHIVEDTGVLALDQLGEPAPTLRLLRDTQARRPAHGRSAARRRRSAPYFHLVGLAVGPQLGIAHLASPTSSTTCARLLWLERQPAVWRPAVRPPATAPPKLPKPRASPSRATRPQPRSNSGRWRRPPV